LLSLNESLQSIPITTYDNLFKVFQFSYKKLKKNGKEKKSNISQTIIQKKLKKLTRLNKNRTLN